MKKLPDKFQHALKLLNIELEDRDMGNNRMYKFVLGILGTDRLTIRFFIEVLGFKTWEANQIKYNVDYHKKRYQIKKLSARKNN